MQVRKLIDSFNYAIDGLIHTLQSQRNMRIHFLITFMVFLLSLNFPLTRMEIIVLTISISMVLVTEMINTSIEATIDLITQEYHELAKVAKNVAAGAVLVSAANSVVVGYLVFIDKMMDTSRETIIKIRETSTHQVFIILTVVLISVIIVKFKTHTGTYLRGGMPSGHVALAFSLLTFIIMESNNLIIIILGFLIALLVAQSRYEAKFHNLFQILSGGLLGSVLTLLLYKVMLWG